MVFEVLCPDVSGAGIESRPIVAVEGDTAAEGYHSGGKEAVRVGCGILGDGVLGEAWIVGDEPTEFEDGGCGVVDMVGGGSGGVGRSSDFDVTGCVVGLRCCAVVALGCEGDLVP